VWIQPDAPTHTGTVTFATWNIEWFPAEAGLKNDVTAEQIRTHMEAVAQLLDAENPTVLVASEVRAFADALALNKMLKHPYPYIAVTDYLAANAPGAEDGANKQEQAIFSRLPWKDVWEIDLGPLPWADNRPPRGFINATIRVRGANVEIYGAHLKANYIRPGTDKPELTALKNVEKRERGVHYLLEDIARRGLKPLTDKIIIAGDFNTDLYAERFAGDKSLRMILQAGFFNAFEGLEPAARVTIPTKNGEVGGPFLDTTFDYILTSVGLGQLRATVVQRGASKNADVGPGSPGHASDHYMVKVTLP
jgi:endonuclease/exonuclease/phosphatase family metal-dependent hydrolase